MKDIGDELDSRHQMMGPALGSKVDGEFSDDRNVFNRRQLLYHAILTVRGRHTLKKLLIYCAFLAGLVALGPSIAQQSAAPGAVPPGAAALGLYASDDLSDAD